MFTHLMSSLLQVVNKQGIIGQMANLHHANILPWKLLQSSITTNSANCYFCEVLSQMKYKISIDGINTGEVPGCLNTYAHYSSF